MLISAFVLNSCKLLVSTNFPARVAVMVAAVTIQATAMWICGKDSAKKKAEASLTLGEGLTKSNGSVFQVNLKAIYSP